MLIEQLYQKYLECQEKVSTDTRKIEAGSLFFALKGANFNGNQFANEAITKGAKFAVVDEPAFATSEKHLLVEDGLKTLQKLAQFRRRQLNIPIIAITGSNGKTTTKELTKLALMPRYKVFATQGNLNNHIGVPLTLLSMPKDTQVAVIEMGDNKLGDIAELCEIAEPTHGYITNIGKDHLEGFGSFENNIRAKSELFDYLRFHHGTPFIPEGDAILSNMSKRFITPVVFGNNFLRLSFLEANPYIKYKDEEGRVWQTQLLGQYNFANIQAVYSIAQHVGVPHEAIHQSICQYIPANNRSQVIEKEGNTYILDAYNANPSSMEAALESFSKMQTTKKKICILGDMLELGETSEKEHLEIVQLAEKLGFKCFFCGKKYFQWKNSTSKFFEDRTLLINYLKQNPLQNSIILLKGSRGMAMEKVLE
jgi:UDP-N-acetylmuramoyl-tripeptide--D-alanyl-D-alanine ligase